eukprot:50416_1
MSHSTQHHIRVISTQYVHALQMRTNEDKFNEPTITNISPRKSKKKRKKNQKAKLFSSKDLLDLLVTGFSNQCFQKNHMSHSKYPLSLNIIICRYFGDFISFDLCPKRHRKTLRRFGTEINREKCRTKIKMVSRESNQWSVIYAKYRASKSKFMYCSSSGYDSGVVEWQIKCHQPSRLDSIGIISSNAVCTNDTIVLKWIDPSVHHYSIGIWDTNDVVTVRLDCVAFRWTVTFTINDKPIETFDIEPNNMYYPFIHSQEDKTKYTVAINCNSIFTDVKLNN